MSCSFGDDVLVNVGDKVVVIDKDTDGEYYERKNTTTSCPLVIP